VAGAPALILALAALGRARFAAAVAALRQVLREPAALREEAAEIQQRICNRFSEPEVMPALLEALFG
jgi:hypothetical protein